LSCTSFFYFYSVIIILTEFLCFIYESRIFLLINVKKIIILYNKVKKQGNHKESFIIRQQIN